MCLAGVTDYRAGVYRAVLTLAALYNLGFGLWAVGWPGSFFALFGMAAPRYPAIWQCLGMVVGLYGLAYAYAGMRLERAKPLVAIGLLGKVLGPVGWCLAVRSGELPFRSFGLILFNDLVWCLPFSLLLLEGTRAGRRIRAAAPHACAALNGLAALGMLFWLLPGTEAVPDPTARADYILRHPVFWRAGWGVWTAAALGLLAFYAWWGAHLKEPAWAGAALILGTGGLACDLVAESIFMGWLPERLPDLGLQASLLAGVAANGLYTMAGTILTLGTGPLPARLRLWTWATWGSGYALSGAALARSPTLTAVFAALLMVLFCPWALFMGRHLDTGIPD